MKGISKLNHQGQQQILRGGMVCNDQKCHAGHSKMFIG